MRGIFFNCSILQDLYIVEYSFGFVLISSYFAPIHNTSSKPSSCVEMCARHKSTVTRAEKKYILI